VSHAPSQQKRHWLTPERVRLYAWASLAVTGITIGRLYYYAAIGIAVPGGYDFADFWSASWLALHGQAIQAYDYKTLLKVAVTISPELSVIGPWLYPPTYLLMIWPLALLPFPVSYLAFEIVAAAVLGLMLRRLLPMNAARWPIAAICCFLPNLLHGQNGTMTACLGLAALLLLGANRQVWAGVCIGLLSVKPQLAILFPIALLCGRMWTAFVSAAVTAAVFAGIAMWVVGPGAFAAFIHANGFARQSLVDGTFPWWQMTTLYATLRLLHVPVTAALVAHAAVAVAATAAMVWIWFRQPSYAIRAAALVTATLLISPYLYLYDAVWLAIPIAFVVQHALQHGWLRGEREMLLLAWMLPVGADSIARHYNVGLGPLVCIGVLVFLVIRTARTDAKIFGKKLAHS